MALRFNRGFDVNNVVKRLIKTVLALYVGGTIMTTFGTTMINTTSPFYTGLSLIGWTVGSRQFNTTPYYCTTCAQETCTNAGLTAPAVNANCITSTSGSGVLAVVGIIAIAQVVTEFITW